MPNLDVLFPLTLPTSMPAFPCDIDALRIYFSFPASHDFKSLDFFEYTIRYQATNKSAIKGTVIASLDGDNPYQKDEKGYYIDIPTKDITLTPGTLYKLQLRYKKNQKASEWSSVCYLKATGARDEISVEIITEVNGDVIFKNSPVFKGIYSNPSDLSEIESRYKFDLCEINGEIIESTGWTTHLSTEPQDSVIFNTELQDFENYRVQYYIETKNGYTQSATYAFSCAFSVLDNPSLAISAQNDDENGYINIEITSPLQDTIAGNLILRRTDSKSNFSIWEDYKYFQVLDTVPEITYKDYLVESGISYKYSISKVSSDGYRGSMIMSNIVSCNYNHMFLVGDNKQLKIELNPQINSFKRQLSEGKVETLGSRYPFITRSGAVNYFTFPINGLISYKQEDAETFCTLANLGILDKDQYMFDFNLTKENFLFERLYREKVEEFLTNGNYKVFKSPSEGIKMVAITNVSLAPIQSLGRMLSSFSATADEIAEPNLKNMLQYGIVDQGEYLTVEQMGVKEEGNILEVNGRITNLWQEIENQVNRSYPSQGYKQTLDHLTYLRVAILNNSLSDYAFEIQTKKDDGSSKKTITIGKDIGVYELNNIVDIYDLKGSEKNNVTLQITYKAVCKYESIEVVNNVINKVGVQELYQLYQNFTEGQQNRDIFKVLESKISGLKVLSLSYLKVDAPAGTVLKINNIEYIIGPIKSLELNDIRITSADFLSESTAASVTVIYNGMVSK